MPSLYELTGEYCLLMSALEDGTDTPEELDALLERFRESEAALFEKFEAYARIDRNLRMNEEMARAEARRLQERAQGYAANRERLREHGAFCMEASGLSKANTSVGTLYWHRSESVEVADESQIPPEYIEFVPKIKAAEIKSALKAGVDIPGARLIQRRTLALR